MKVLIEFNANSDAFMGERFMGECYRVLESTYTRLHNAKEELDLLERAAGTTDVLQDSQGNNIGFLHVSRTRNQQDKKED